MGLKYERVSLDAGKLYSRLFNLSQEGDYDDFQKFTREEIYPFIKGAKLLVNSNQKIKERVYYIYYQ